MQDLWEKMRQGDADAMLALYESNYADLLSYGVQLTGSVDTAKDVINDVFLHLWEHHGKLKPVLNVRAYLFACTRRRIFHPAYFNNKVLSASEIGFYEEGEMPYEDLLIEMQRSDEIRIKVQAALEKLTPRQKELIQLKYFKNMDYRQIEKETGISAKTAYNTIYNAIKVLETELRGTGISITAFLAFFSEINSGIRNLPGF